jgi:hypothetical protein
MAASSEVLSCDQTATERDDAALRSILEMHEITHNAGLMRAMRDAVAFGEMKARNKPYRN